MSNLRLINETTASSVSTFQATDIFSTDYDIYKLEINNLDLATAGYLRAKFIDSSGSVIASSSYDWAFLDMITYGSPFTQQRTAGDTNIAVAYGGNTATADAGGFIIYVFNMYFGGGVLPQASTVDGIRVTDNFGNMTGTIKLFGVKEI